MNILLSPPALIALILVALAFDFLNGLNDTANSIATLVSTRMLRPRYAVLWAAFFNFIAFLVFGVHVARTVGVGIVSADVMDAHVIFGALIGAICWHLMTWRAGIPSSSSHALIGGLVGAGVTKAGIASIVWPGLLTTAAAIVLSPTFGFLWPCCWCSACRGRSCAPIRATSRARSAGCNSQPPPSFRSATAATTRRRPWASSRCCCFRRGQLGHEFYVPFWVVITCQAAMGLGTWSAAGGSSTQSARRSRD